MRPARLLERLNRGDVTNVRFADVRTLLDALGFQRARTKGSHHVFVHRRAGCAITLQEVKLGRLVWRYRLTLDDR